MVSWVVEGLLMSRCRSSERELTQPTKDSGRVPRLTRLRTSRVECRENSVTEVLNNRRKQLKTWKPESWPENTQNEQHEHLTYLWYGGDPMIRVQTNVTTPTQPTHLYFLPQNSTLPSFL